MLLHQGKPDKALPLLKRAHEMNPMHIDAAINLSGAFILTKKFKRAVDILEPLSRQYPENAMIWTNLGAAYLGNPVLARDEDRVRAIAAFQRALDNDPFAPNVAYNIGLIFRDRQEYEAAKHWFGRAIQSNPNDVHARRILNQLAQKEASDGQDD